MLTEEDDPSLLKGVECFVSERGDIYELQSVSIFFVGDLVISLISFGLPRWWF